MGLAMANAQRRAHEERDAAALRDQVSRWRQAQEIASYCDAVAERLRGEPPGSQDVKQAQKWLSWARAYATSLNPLQSLPTAPERLELMPEDLKPYLDGWSPYGPEESRRRCKPGARVGVKTEVAAHLANMPVGICPRPYSCFRPRTAMLAYASSLPSLSWHLPVIQSLAQRVSGGHRQRPGARRSGHRHRIWAL
jgi:hypothetical protein